MGAPVGNRNAAKDYVGSRGTKSFKRMERRVRAEHRASTSDSATTCAFALPPLSSRGNVIITRRGFLAALFAAPFVPAAPTPVLFHRDAFAFSWVSPPLTEFVIARKVYRSIGHDGRVTDSQVNSFTDDHAR